MVSETSMRWINPPLTESLPYDSRTYPSSFKALKHWNYSLEVQ
ncbi:hypothetical protein TNCT_118741, partial [Trichonephila clavata]